MKKFFAGLLVGLLLTSASFVNAGSDIKLIVNGNEVVTDVPPQVINGRTMIPARPLAEALGAKVEWDGSSNSVVVDSVPTVQPKTQTAPTTTIKTEGVTNVDFMNGRELIEALGARYPEMVKANATSITLANDGTLKFGEQTFNLTKNSEGKFDIQPLKAAEIL